MLCHTRKEFDVSRSYKHNVIVKYAKDTWYKKYFNRKVRRNSKFQSIPDGNAYKKLNNTWDICDFPCRADYNDFKTWRWVQERFDNEEESKAYWASHYKTK